MNVPSPAFAETWPDASLCPLCGQPNQCAMEIAKTSGEPQPACWCTTMNFTAELLAQIPASAKNRACVCHACASQRTSE